MFYCEFFEISKNTFFIEDLWTAASELRCCPFLQKKPTAKSH